MNKKGFTLAELLGVIVILGLICLVAFPPILDSINKSKNNISESTLNIIYSASDIYVSNHPSSFKLIENNKYCIQIQDLIDEGNLSGDLKDPNTNQKINPEKHVKVEVKNNKYIYSMAKGDEC